MAQTTTVVTTIQQNVRDWNTGVLSCMDDVKGCKYTSKKHYAYGTMLNVSIGWNGAHRPIMWRIKRTEKATSIIWVQMDH